MDRIEAEPGPMAVSPSTGLKCKRLTLAPVHSSSVSLTLQGRTGTSSGRRERKMLGCAEFGEGWWGDQGGESCAGAWGWVLGCGSRWG